MACVNCSKSTHGEKNSRCEIGHSVCVTCLEDQVKAIFSGKVKQMSIKCPASNCDKVITYDELKQTLPQFVVDILEEKLDKAYFEYIKHWLFTDEQLKSRSEFATSETVKKNEGIYTPESRDSTEDLPSVWTQMKRGAPFMVFEVVPGTEEYTALAEQFHRTLHLPIVCIIRVQNPILWKYFALKRSEMVQENDGMDVAEINLFHRTHRSTLEAIARKGFDWRMSGKHGTVFGWGSYFAKESRYSHRYTDCAGRGVSVRWGAKPSSLTHGHLRPLPSYKLTQPTVTPLMGRLTSPLSQTHPLQVPASQFHLPPPPPNQGHMSSLQVLAHYQTSGPQPIQHTSATTCLLQSGSQPIQHTSETNHLLPSGSTTLPSPNDSPLFASSSTNSTFHLSASQSFTLKSVRQNSSCKLSNNSSNNRVNSTCLYAKKASMNKVNSMKEGASETSQARGKGSADLTSVFCQDAKTKSHFMFVARVLVGRHTCGSQYLKRPPPLDQNKPFGKCYDSCVDNIISPQVYVIFDRNQAYPEYVIKYTCNKDTEIK